MSLTTRDVSRPSWLSLADLGRGRGQAEVLSFRETGYPSQTTRWSSDRTRMPEPGQAHSTQTKARPSVSRTR